MSPLPVVRVSGRAPHPATGAMVYYHKAAQAPCGCAFVQGTTLDTVPGSTLEPVLAAVACARHGDACEAVMERMRTMPPSDDDVLALASRLWEEEVGDG